jgi:hypothetical protein
MTNLTSTQFAKAASIKARIEELEQELRGVFGQAAQPVTGPVRSGRKFSAGGLARIAAAQKKRWAKYRKTQRN